MNITTKPSYSDLNNLDLWEIQYENDFYHEKIVHKKSGIFFMTEGSKFKFYYRKPTGGAASAEIVEPSIFCFWKRINKSKWLLSFQEHHIAKTKEQQNY
jgi:hypothetical protein